MMKSNTITACLTCLVLSISTLPTFAASNQTQNESYRYITEDSIQRLNDDMMNNLVSQRVKNKLEKQSYDPSQAGWQNDVMSQIQQDNDIYHVFDRFEMWEELRNRLFNEVLRKPICLHGVQGIPEETDEKYTFEHPNSFVGIGTFGNGMEQTSTYTLTVGRTKEIINFNYKCIIKNIELNQIPCTQQEFAANPLECAQRN